MKWTLYVLRCADGSLYTGITNALAERVATHNAGKGAKYTRSRRPVVLVWSRQCASESAARRMEREVKGLTRAEKLRLVEGK